jgi:hypothetical protein
MENDDLKYENPNGDDSEHPLNKTILPQLNPNQSLRIASQFMPENVDEMKDLNLCFGCNIRENMMRQCSNCLKEYCSRCIRDDVTFLCRTCKLAHRNIEVSK